MASSQGNGGRATTGAMSVLSVPAGLDLNAERVQSTQGRKGIEIPDFFPGLFATLLLGKGTYPVTVGSVSQDQTAQKKARAWAKTQGCMVGFTTPEKVTEKVDGKDVVTSLTRGYWAYFAKDADPEDVAKIEAIRSEHEAELKALAEASA